MSMGQIWSLRDVGTQRKDAHNSRADLSQEIVWSSRTDKKAAALRKFFESTMRLIDKDAIDD